MLRVVESYGPDSDGGNTLYYIGGNTLSQIDPFGDLNGLDGPTSIWVHDLYVAEDLSKEPRIGFSRKLIDMLSLTTINYNRVDDYRMFPCMLLQENGVDNYQCKLEDGHDGPCPGVPVFKSHL